MEDIARFLAEHLSGCGLTAAAAADLASRLEIEYFPHGARLFEARGGPVDALWVIRAGAVDLLDPEGGAWRDRRGEGDLLLGPEWAAGRPPDDDGVAREDVLAYRLPREALEALPDREVLRRALSAGPGDRLRQASRAGEGAAGTAVGDLLERPPLSADPDTPADEAARRMAAEGVSSLLVPGDPPGIVTDRDFRDRLVARGLDLRTPLSRIRSAPLVTVPAEASWLEALARMLDRGIHHLVVTREGRPAGVVTDTDLLRHRWGSPLLLGRSLERARDDGARAAWVARAGEALGGAGLAGLPASGSLRVASLAADRLVRQVLGGVLEGLGPAPGAWCWAFPGAAGRRESPWPPPRAGRVAWDPAGGEALGRWAAGLCDAVDGALARAGLPAGEAGTGALPAGPGAAAELARGSLDRLADALDLRPVAGPLDPAPFLEGLREAARSAGAHRRLAARLARAPARGVFRGCLLEDDGTCTEALDLDRRCLEPLADLGRLAALRGGVAERSTPGRLRAAGEAGLLAAALGADLAAAWEFAAGLRDRLDRQGTPGPVRPGALDAGDRRGLADVLALLRRGVAALAAGAEGEGPWRA